MVRIVKVDIDKQFRRCKLLGMDIRYALSEMITLLARQRCDMMYVIPRHVEKYC